MKSKKLLVLLVLFFIGIVKVNAAYLKDYVSKYTNPDGKELTIYITGDEYFRYVHDKKKNVLIKNEQGYYTYATLDNGKVVSSNNIYDMKNIPSKTIKASDIDLSKNQDLVHKFEQKTKSKSSFKSSKKRSQKEGSIDDVLNFNNTIVFVRFKGESEFVNDSLINSLKHILGETNNDETGLKSYVHKVTEGHVNTNSNILQVKNNKYYSYESTQPRGYLQEKSSSNSIGYNTVSEGDKRLLGILNEAIRSLPVTDTNNVDANGDGVVDNFIFIVSGYGDGWNEPLWPHKWDLTSDFEVQQYSGAWVSTYNLQLAEDGDMSEDLSVFCHETMHSLGLPDLYRYSYDGDPVGVWDMMNENDEGTYVTTHIRNRHGYVKVEGNTWSSELTVIDKTGSYELNLVSTNTGIRSYKINTEDENQFIQLEYRGSSGDVYDSKLPYDGLLISRINLKYEGNEGEDGIQDEYYIYRPNEDMTEGGGGYIDNAAIQPCAGLINCTNKFGNSSVASSLRTGAIALEDNTNTRIIVKNVEYSGVNKIKFSVFLNGESVYIENTDISGLVNDEIEIKPVFLGSKMPTTYTSSDDSIASVNSSGVVTLNGVGQTTITVRVNGTNYYVNVNVLPARISSLNLNLNDAKNITLNYEFDSSSNLEVQSYLIYRSTDGVNFNLLNETSDTTYVDNNFDFGNTYYYKVGFKYNDNIYDSDLIKSVDTLSYLPSKTNINNWTINSINSGRIEFSNIDDAIGYQIVVSDNPIGPFEEFDTTVNNYYDLDIEPAKNYYIKVASFKVTSGEKYLSEYSNIVLLNSREKLLESPGISSAQLISESEIKINYNSKEGASGYNIYVSNDNKNYKLLVSDNKTTSYTHEGIEFGKTYYYKVSAILDNNYEGYRSNSYKIIANQVTPTNFKVTSNGYDSILISYDEIDNASGYEIYYSQDNSSFKLLVDTTKISYKHTKLKFNKNYYYKVRSYRVVNGKKVYSNYTLVLSAKALTSAPKVVLTQLDDGKVKIDYSSDKYANNYKIYLQTDNTSYNLLTTTKKTSYTIKNLKLSDNIKIKVVSYKDSTKGNETILEHSVTLRSPIIKVNGNTINIDGVKNATHYDIYKCSDECKILTSTTNLSYSSDEINNNSIYSYYALAYNDEYTSLKSDYISNISSFKMNSVSAKSSNSNEVKFTINTSVEFDGYELQMSSKKSSGFKKVLDSTLKEFKYNKTTLNKTYYFKVRPFNKINGKKYYGKTSSVITYKQTLNKIDSIKLTNVTSSSIKVTFDKVNKAKGYNLYYRVGESGSFKKVNLSKNNYTLNNLNFNDKVYFKVNSYMKVSGKTVTSPTSSVVATIVKSPIPKYTITSLTPTSVRIDIDSNEITAYNIAYGLSENSFNKVLLSNSNSVTINNLETNKTYYFKVSEKVNGVVGEGEIKSHSMAPVIPNVKYNRVDKNTANITWDNQGNNVFYQVYLQNNKIYDGQKNSLTEENLITGKEYTYRIRSYIIVGGEKQYSDYKEVAVRCLFDRINNFITNLNTSLNKLNVDYELVNGNVHHYVLLSSSSSNGEYSVIATSNTNRFSNVSVTPGKTYYLKVSAVVIYNNQEYYDEESNYIVFKALPKVPDSVKTTNVTYNQIKINWSKVSDINGYELYFSTSKDSGYKKLTTTTSTSYTHKKLKVNKKYYYKVRTYKVINNKKYYSDYSTVVSRTALPAAPTNVKVSRYNYSATMNKISWSASSNVSGYYVYRSNNGDSYTYIGKTTGTSYTDKNAFIYGEYYKVKSYKTVGGKKYFSDYSSVVHIDKPLDPDFRVHTNGGLNTNTLYETKSFANDGSLPITILSSGAYTKDADLSTFDRTMTLVDEKTNKEISKITIGAGEVKNIKFKFNKSTWIDNNTKFYYYIVYDGIKYKVMSSSNGNTWNMV